MSPGQEAEAVPTEYRKAGPGGPGPFSSGSYGDLREIHYFTYWCLYRMGPRFGIAKLVQITINNYNKKLVYDTLK